MFRIGAFSKLTRVSVRMLRYYDDAGLLTPAVIDKFTGYRMYTTDQIPVLQKICLLRDMGFNVTEIGAVMECWESSSVTEYLEDKKRQLLDSIRLEQQRIQKIEIAMRDFKESTIETHHNVTIKSVPGCKILSLRKTVADYYCEGRLWEQLYAFVREEQVKLRPGINNLAIYHNGGITEDGVDIEVGVMVEREGADKGGFCFRETEPVEDMACIMVYGPYENIGLSYHAFACWMEEHSQYEIAGPSRQICHIGSWDESDSQKFLTEVQTPVRRILTLTP